MDKLPLLDLDFRTTYVENNVLYTPSKGSLVSKAVMGTGVPGNVNAPSITGVGASFSGNDYVDTGAELFEYNSPFSIVIHGRLSSNPAYSNGYAICCGSLSGTFTGLTITISSGYIYYSITKSGVGLSGWSNFSKTPPKPITVIFTYNGSGSNSGMAAYINGDRNFDSSIGTISQSIKTGVGARIAATTWSTDYLVAGMTMRRFQVFPFALSPAQVRAIHEKFEREGEA